MERTEDPPRPRDPHLAERARRLIRPAELASDEPLLWSAGKGTDVWDLFLACMTGDLVIVQRLIAADPSLVRAHYEYRTPLSFAVRENQIEVAAFLIERGALVEEDLLEAARDRGYTDLERMLAATRASQLEAALQAQAAASRTDDDIWTAARTGDVERVRRLLDRDPGLVNRQVGDAPNATTALTRAAAGGHLDVVRLLLERGADPNLREVGNAPHGHALYAAVYTGRHEIAALLLEHGAYPNPEVESSADALSIAIMNSDTRMIDLLVSHGAVWQISVTLAPDPASA